LPDRIVVSSSGLRDAEIDALLARMDGLAPIVLSDSLFEKLSSVVTPTGLIAVVRTPRAHLDAQRLGACVMIEAVQDPGNLGSILRTAAAARITDVLLSPDSVQAWSPRVLRAAMGAHFLLRIHEGADLPATIGGYRGSVIATARQAGQSLFDTDLKGDVALLFGNEGAGLSAELTSAAHTVVAIPMPGGAESLNVAAAAAVCLFERVRQIAVGSKR